MSALRRLSVQNDVIDNNVGTTLDTNNLRQDIADYDHVVAGAKHATDVEHSMTFRQGLKRYPKAVMWSFLLSTAMYVYRHPSLR